MYTISIYFFARDKFNFKDLLNLFLKFLLFGLPFCPFSKLLQVPIPKEFNFALEMGAYTSLTLQLIIFGTYLYSVKVKSIPWKLSLQISFVKHILLQ